MPKVASFAEYVGQHRKTREDIKPWFDALYLHDYVSFGGNRKSLQTQTELTKLKSKAKL
jgi:hypothetical protein